MNKAVEKQINEIYNAIYKKVFTESAMTSFSKGSTDEVLDRIAKLSSSDKFDEFCKKFAKELAKKGLITKRGVWRKFFKAAKASHRVVLPFTLSEFEQQQLEKAVIHNFEMIKSIPSKIMEVVNHKYATTLIEQVAKGTLPRGSFEKQIKVHAGKQAKVIARTETAKLQTIILENRSRDLGSIAYIWRSSKDVRTRPSHRMMNGVVVFWREYSQKPLLDKMRGNAGEFPNCRCDERPIFDEEDLTLNNYKVYDYRSDTIINMTKKDLLEAIQKGGLD